MTCKVSLVEVAYSFHQEGETAKLRMELRSMSEEEIQ